MAITPVFAIRLDPELRAELQSLADADNRSLANYIETILRAHVGLRTWSGGDTVDQNGVVIRKGMRK